MVAAFEAFGNIGCLVARYSTVRGWLRDALEALQSSNQMREEVDVERGARSSGRRCQPAGIPTGRRPDPETRYAARGAHVAPPEIRARPWSVTTQCSPRVASIGGSAR